MLSVETGGGEHMIAGIGVHVILFAVNGEIADSGEERILRLHDIHDIVNGVSRMRNPLSADHELVVCMFPEGVAHSAVPSSDAGSAGDGVQKPFCRFAGNGSHGPDGNNQVIFFVEFRIGQAFHGIENIHVNIF